MSYKWITDVYNKFDDQELVEFPDPLVVTPEDYKAYRTQVEWSPALGNHHEYALAGVYGILAMFSLRIGRIKTNDGTQQLVFEYYSAAPTPKFLPHMETYYKLKGSYMCLSPHYHVLAFFETLGKIYEVAPMIWYQQLNRLKITLVE